MAFCSLSVGRTEVFAPITCSWAMCGRLGRCLGRLNVLNRNIYALSQPKASEEPHKYYGEDK